MNVNDLINAQLSEAAYRGYDQSDVEKETVALVDGNGHTWTVYAVAERAAYDSGFTGVAFRNNETRDVVVSYAGTDSLRDLTPDLQIFFGRNVPTQYGEAFSFYEEVENMAIVDKIGTPSLAGHSLGGALAQLVGAVTGAETAAFNAPGVKDVLDNNPGIFGEFSPAASFAQIRNYNYFIEPVSLVGEQLGTIINVGVDASTALMHLAASTGVLGLFYSQYRQHSINTLIARMEDLVGQASRNASPVILDLDGDGITTRGFADGVYFDHNGDGFSQLTGWVGANDGLLVRDLDGNGVIDNGGELFGDSTITGAGRNAANGFAALAEYDSNGDGLLDAADALWSELRVWRDSNRDGRSQAAELVGLEDLAIASINLAYSDSHHVDEHGNEHRQVGSFTWADGSAGTATDVWFATDSARTRAVEQLPLSAEVATLPELQAFGKVHSLQQAMMRDDTGRLQALVREFTVTTDETRRLELLDGIIYHWAGSAAIDPASRGVFVDARQLHAVEAFLGESFLQRGTSPNPRTNAGRLLGESYDILKKEMYSALMMQTHLQPLLGAIRFSFGEDGLGADFSAMEQQLEVLFAADQRDGLQTLMSLRDISGSTLRELGWESEGQLNRWLATAYAIDVASLPANVDYSRLVATLTQTYRYDVADGAVRVRHNSTYAKAGILEFGEGIAPEDLSLIKDGNHLFVAVAGDDNSNGAGVWLHNWFSGSRYQTASVRFADGSTLATADWLQEQLVTTRAVAGNQTLSGYAGRDRMIGHDSGINSLYAGAGDDVLIAGQRDRLYAQAGDNLLVGAGGALLYGGSGNDTYRYDRGAGTFRVYHNNTNAATGTLAFGDGITPEDLQLVKDGNHLFVAVAGDDNSNTAGVWLHNWFSGSRYQTASVRFADGSTLETADWLQTQLVTTRAAAGNQTLSGHAGRDRMIGHDSGINSLYAGAGDDVLIAGQRDRLYAQAGDNLLVGAAGALLYGGSGNDTYRYDRGAGTFRVYHNNTNAATGTLAFGDGITPEDLQLVKDGNHLFVAVAGDDNSNTAGVWLHNWFSGSRYQTASLRFADGSTLETADWLQKQLVTTRAAAGNQTLSGHAGRDRMIGHDTGINSLYAGTGDDVLIAGQRDRLYAQAGDNLLVGAAGALLYGGSGNDTYRYDRGAGTFRVYHNNTNSAAGILAFGEEIAPEDLALIKEGNHLFVAVGGAGSSSAADGVWLHNWFSGSRYQPATLQFATTGEPFSGTLMDLAAVQIHGTSANNNIYGTSGADILTGGKGNDYLKGGLGNDLYRFAAGDGIDRIDNIDPQGVDRIAFAASVDPDSVAFYRNGRNLVLDYGSGDRITINNHFSGASYAIDEVHLADGRYLGSADINQLIEQICAYAVAEGISLSSIEDVKYNPELMTMVAGSWQTA